MLPAPYSNNAMKWLAKGFFLVLASFLLSPSAVQAATKTLTMNVSPSGGGTVSPGTGNVNSNATVNISATAAAAACYAFVNWTGATVANANSASTSISMGGQNRSVTANFKLITYTISANPGAGGTITPVPSIVCSNGSSVVTITPNPGYTVASVTDSVAGNISIPAAGGGYTLTNITENHTITATFSRKTFTITASAAAGGSISPAGAVTVGYGDAPVFALTPNTGYSVDKVEVDGVYISMTGNSYAFPPVNADHSIKVLFKVIGTSGTGGSSYISGCSASTYNDYSGGFNAADFSMINAAVSSNGTIILQTGAQSINPNSIVIPFEQTVGVTFLYENAGYSRNNFGWMLASEGPGGTKHEVYHHVNDNNNNGVLDDREGIDANHDGVVNMLDNRVVLNNGTAFAAGTELVFYLNVEEGNPYTCFTKQDWNTDVFHGNCTTSPSFDKTFYLGTYAGYSNCGPSQWLDTNAVNRLNAAPLYLNLQGTSQTIHITQGQKFPHVMVGAPADKPNEWVLGWEDWNTGGDYDINDMVFRIDRQTGGSTELQLAKAIEPSDPDAYFTSVTISVYDNMPCSGKTTIKYYLSIDGGIPTSPGANPWIEITEWDTVNSFTSSGGTKTVGDVVNNWKPGSPAQTYRTRRVDFSGVMHAGRQLVWKAVMFSSDETCVPEIINVALSGSTASHSFISRASPSVQTNVMYSGNYETPDASWTDKVPRGHLYASRLYDPADPSQQNVLSLWDAGEVLNAMSPDSRNIKYPDIAIYSVANEPIGTGDGVNKNFSGTLANHPISATSVKITDGIEVFIDKHTDVLEGSLLGTGTINRFTGVYNFNFNNAPTPGIPIVASYKYYTTASALKPFTTANITNSMLGLDNTFVVPTGFKYDLDRNGAFTEADGQWLVGWVRGYKNPLTSTKKEWLLGQVDHSVPAVETPPGMPAWYYGTSVTKEERKSFNDFVSAKWERPTVVYVGSLDGMLHAFDAGNFRWGYMNGGVFQWGDNPATIGITDYRGYFKWQGSTSGTADYGTGRELWAFIPANLISRLKNNLLSAEDQAYVDASPALSDVYINNAWKTVLLSAEGSGGDTVSCLDVTDPYNPTFMWEFADPDLFRSRSSPAVAVVGRINTDGTSKWVAFFVSGKTYDNTLYPSIYMIDIADGSVLQRVFLDSEPNGIGGVPSGQPAVVDSDGNGFIDRMYIGTDKGYLYKITIPDNPSGSSSYGITNCVINRDFTDSFGNSVASNQQYHPIYASPAVVVANTYASDGTIDYKVKILFGTGDSPYFDENINTADTTYHFFAYVDTAAKGVCNVSSVYLDWLYALPPGERIFASAFAAAGSIYFGTSTSETEDPCEGAGNPASNNGRLYVMDINQTDSVTTKFIMNTGNILSAPVVDDQHLYVKTVGNGMMTTPGPYNNPIVMGGLAETSVSTWREIFGKDEPLVP
jgi:type IV pilus assembly protein PilY1